MGKDQQIKNAIRRLKEVCIPDAESSVCFLYEEAFKNKGGNSLLLFESFIQRRILREPVQYIIGEWNFHNISLKMKSPILIPRPETEELVEFVLQSQPKKEKSQYFLDIGTGTGAIALALLHERQHYHCVAIDINPIACELARENAKLLNLESRFHCPPAISISEFNQKQCFDFIVSNPPYIPTQDLANLQPEIRLFESHLALDGCNMFGDKIAKIILKKAEELLIPGGQLFLELYHEHNSDFIQKNWMNSSSKLKIKSTKKDFNGIERFFCLSKAPEKS